MLLVFANCTLFFLQCFETKRKTNLWLVVQADETKETTLYHASTNATTCTKWPNHNLLKMILYVCRTHILDIAITYLSHLIEYIFAV